MFFDVAALTSAESSVNAVPSRFPSLTRRRYSDDPRTVFSVVPCCHLPTLNDTWMPDVSKHLTILDVEVEQCSDTVNRLI